MYLATPLGIQKNIIEDLNINSPVYIIYKSDVDTYGHVGNRLKLIDNYIKDKYSFFEKFNHWEIYKKKIEMSPIKFFALVLDKLQNNS